MLGSGVHFSAPLFFASRHAAAGPSGAADHSGVSYAYSNWMSRPTLRERLDTARLHHAEVEADVSATISAGGGKSRDSSVLDSKLRRLEQQIQDMERRLGDERGPSFLRVDMR